jgi:hypothetical protein
MIIKSPFMISSRLLAAAQVGGATVSLEPTGRADRDGKPRWKWYIDLADGSEFSDDDLRGWGDTRAMMETLLGFLGACGESVAYGERTGRTGENADLFPAAVGQWAAQWRDEISMMELEIGENSDCVTE